MNMTAKQTIYNKIYFSIVDELGEESAKSWANSTVKTYEDGAYKDLDQLIDSTITYALTGGEG